MFEGLAEDGTAVVGNIFGGIGMDEGNEGIGAMWPRTRGMVRSRNRGEIVDNRKDGVRVRTVAEERGKQSSDVFLSLVKGQLLIVAGTWGRITAGEAWGRDWVPQNLTAPCSQPTAGEDLVSTLHCRGCRLDPAAVLPLHEE